MIDTTRPESIPGVERFHRREEWIDSTYPVTGPRPTLDQVDTFPSHYTAAADVPGYNDGRTVAQIILAVFAFLRAIQRDYTLNRGYSIGYGFAVDGLGGVYELRGYDFKNAANRNWNHRTLPVLLLLDGGAPATPAQLYSLNALYAEGQRRCGRSLVAVGHRDIGATACPGPGHYAQITGGLVVPLDFTNHNPPPFSGNLTGGKPMRALKNHDRIVDTRTSEYGPFAPGKPHLIGTQFGAHHRDYAQAEALAIRVAGRGTGPGYISVWSDGGDVDNVAVNFRPGEWESDLVLVGVDDGAFYLQTFGATAHVTIDVQGVQLPDEVAA